jgi:hypothetical protein
MEKTVSTFGWYSSINSTKSLTSGAGNISKLMLMSQFRECVKSVGVDQCVSAIGALDVPVCACLS